MNIPNESLLRTSEAARFLNVSPNTLARWRFFGQGPQFSKFAGNVRYQIEDLRAYVAGHMQQGHASRVEGVAHV